MVIDFDQIQETVIPAFHGGKKEAIARMYKDGLGKIMYGKLEPGASIGMHKHETSSEIVYVIQGTAEVLYDDGRETVLAGGCHYCPKGHSHSMINNGTEDLLIFSVIPEFCC